MAPPVTLGALLLVVALVPGWMYLRLIERLQPPSGTTGLNQLLEVLATGVGTTGASTMAVILVPHRWLPFTLDLSTWAVDDSYLRTHVRAAVWSVALVFAIAVVLAYGLYQIRKRWRKAEFHTGDVWFHSIAQRPPETHPFVGLGLKDGRLIEGPLHAYTSGEEPGKRDIALGKPIWITPAGDTTPQPLPNLDRLVVPESALDSITVIYMPAADPRKHSGREKKRQEGP